MSYKERFEQWIEDCDPSEVAWHFADEWYVQAALEFALEEYIEKFLRMDDSEMNVNEKGCYKMLAVYYNDNVEAE